MNVDKQWLERKIAELNDWLQQAENNNHPEYSLNQHNRNYYVNKLIELDDHRQKTINV